MIRAAAGQAVLPTDDYATCFAARIGQNLMQARAALGASQELVGDLAGLHRTAFGQLERGERIPRTDYPGQARGGAPGRRRTRWPG